MPSNINTKSNHSPLLTAAAGLAAASFLNGCRTLGQTGQPKVTAGHLTFTFADIPGTGNTKVLNYALALETLESNFYDQAVKRLTTGGKDTRGNPIPGLHLPDDEPDVRFTNIFSRIEEEHRTLLQTTLTTFQGLSALKPSTYDFNIQSMTRRQVMETLYTIEQTGARAYLGALKYFPTNQYVRIAVALQGTESRHTAAIAAINNLLFNSNQNPYPLSTDNHGLETALEPDAVLASLSKFILER